jgi:hypothetical protein
MGFLGVLTSMPSSHWLVDVVSFTIADLLKTPIASFFIFVLLPLFYRGQIDSRETLETVEPYQLEGQDLWVLVNKFPIFDDTAGPW